MNAIQFIKEHGVEKAREVITKDQFVADLCLVTPSGNLIYYKEVKGSFPEVTDFGKFGLIADYYLMVDLSDLKRLVESVDIISKFDSVQEAKDAIANAPDGATDYRKLSCTIRYIKQSKRFFEYWDGSIWCRPTVPFTDETHILRFTELSKLKQAIADYEQLFGNTEKLGGEHV